MIGETNLQTSGGTTLIVYLAPTSSAGTLATNAAPQPPVGTCPSGAEIAIGDFTSLTPTPVVVFYSAGQAVNWTPAVQPRPRGRTDRRHLVLERGSVAPIRRRHRGR